MLIGAVLVWMAVLSAFDVTQRRLPNALTLPGAVVILTGAAIAGLFAVYLVVHLVSPAAMGAGDVKLAIGLGAVTGCFGAEMWFLAALAAPLLTAVIGILARLGWSAKALPHGPSMCAVSAVTVGFALL